MTVVAALIVFSALMAFVCAKARAAGPALLSGVVCVVLICTTPLGSAIPTGLAHVAGWVGDNGAHVAEAGH